MVSKAVRARCPACKRTRAASVATRWCDVCGAELVRIRYGPKRKARRG